MKRFLGIAAVCVAVFFGQGGAARAASAPAWSIVAIPYPTAFEAGSADDSRGGGPGFQIEAFNVGGAPTSGEFTVIDYLPGPLRVAAGFEPSGVYGPAAESATRLGLNCAAVGHTITCKGGGAGTEVGPGEGVTVTVPIEVDGSASGTLLDKALIEGGGAAAAATSVTTKISATPSPFGFIAGAAGLFGFVNKEDGSAATLAGSHPYAATVAGMTLATTRNTPGLGTVLGADGGLREAAAELPSGFVVDPSVTPHCYEKELVAQPFGCPDDTQVGVMALTLSIVHGLAEATAMRPLYNMDPPPGYPAELGFEVSEGVYVHLLGSVRSDGSFTLVAVSKDILAASKAAIAGIRPILWGNPSAESHDAQRGQCLYAVRKQPRCPVERTHKAFVTLPAACSGPLTTTVHVGSWLGAQDERSYESAGPDGHVVGVDGCESLKFEPTIKAAPTTEKADSPSGLDFDLLQPQNQAYETESGKAQRSTAPLKDTTVTLPDGLSLNPSAAGGLEACSTAQIGLTTVVGQAPIRYREEPAHCPNAAKLGTVKVTTPLLKEGPSGGQVPHVLPGAIFLAEPFDNPFDSLLAIYLVIEDESSGVTAKLAGKVEPDPTTGQLRTTFQESPQLPLEDVRLHFFDGARAALTTPLTCGAKTTTGALTPWSRPSPTAVGSSFEITSAPGGGTCPLSEAQAPNSPSLSAGTTDPLAGAYSPFVLTLTRPDGSQRIFSIDTTLPEGLTGKLAGIPYCPDAQIEQAQARDHAEEGKLELGSPSCPRASEVGTVTVGAGSGPSPVYVTGHAYLAGPYKGAPLSMVIITPAVTGPFDLGVVVVRVALEVDLETAQIHAVSDPLPTILDGIPLDVRSIALELGRPEFTLNPTDCAAQPLTVTAASSAGSTATVSERFGVEGCGRLAFKPKLKIQLKGASRRTGHPALKAVVTMPQGGADIARAQVGLPHALFLDQGNLNKVCKQADLKAATCPKSSIYGHAKAWTPLLEKPLQGPVYLGVGYGYKLPALVADLDGQVRILLHGRVDTTKRKGLRNTFEVVPDAPISRFVLQMKGGKKYSLLENSENLCGRTQRANARFVAQNGRVAQMHPAIVTSCKGRNKAKRKQHIRHRR